MWLLRCIGNSQYDHYSRSSGGGMLGGAPVNKDTPKWPKSGTRLASLDITH